MGWDTTLPAQPSSRAAGKSEAGGLAHQFPLKKEPSGFPAKNNRNRLILHALRVLSQEGKGSIKTQRLLPCFAWPAMRFCLRYSFAPKPPVPASPSPSEHPGRLGGCVGDLPCGSWAGMATAHPQLGTELAAPIARSQLVLGHLSPVKSYGSPETRGRGGESRPVQLLAANHAVARPDHHSKEQGRSARHPPWAVWGNPRRSAGPSPGPRGTAPAAGPYGRGDAGGSGCPSPERAGAGVVVATAEQLPSL